MRQVRNGGKNRSMDSNVRVGPIRRSIPAHVDAIFKWPPRKREDGYRSEPDPKKPVAVTTTLPG